MPKIVIGKSGRNDVSFDLELLLRTRLLVQANSGGGKSFLLRRLAEQLFGKVQVLLIDREGEFASLREKFGYVLIGQGGDAPADIRSARLLAEKLLELRASTVFDLYEAFRSRPGDRRAWVRAFLEGLVDAPKALWHDVVVIVDESHQFCPQEVPKAASMIEREIISGCKDAMISLATIGRKRGLCAIWATQRLAKLDKDASAELFNRLVGMTVEDVDVDRAVDLMSVSRDEKPEFKKRLRDLEPGNFFAFGRAISKERILVKVGSVVTTHPEPGFQKHGNEPPPPPEKVKALLPKLKDLPKEVETRAKTEAELRHEIRTLKASLAASAQLSEMRKKIDKPIEIKLSKPETIRVEVPFIPASQLVRLERAMAAADRAAGKAQDTLGTQLGSLREFSDLIRDNIRKIELAAKRPVASLAVDALVRSHPPATPFHRKATPSPVQEGNGEGAALPGLAKRILKALLTFESFGFMSVKRSWIAGWLSLSYTSGGFRNTLGGLRSGGLISYPSNDTLSMTGEGRGVSPLPDVDPEASAILEHCLHAVAGQQAKILRVVHGAYPDSVSRIRVAEELNVSPTSGGFRNSLGGLRTAGMITYPDTEALRCSDWMFTGVALPLRRA
jgi:hypothetical protein